MVGLTPAADASEGPGGPWVSPSLALPVWKVESVAPGAWNALCARRGKGRFPGFVFLYEVGQNVQDPEPCHVSGKPVCPDGWSTPLALGGAGH